VWKRDACGFGRPEHFCAAKDPQEVKRLGDHLGRFVFGNTTNP